MRCGSGSGHCEFPVVTDVCLHSPGKSPGSQKVRRDVPR